MRNWKADLFPHLRKCQLLLCQSWKENVGHLKMESKNV